MQLAGLSDRTHESYLRAVRKFAQWLNKSPHLASENDLRRYLLFIKNDLRTEVPMRGVLWRRVFTSSDRDPRCPRKVTISASQQPHSNTTMPTPLFEKIWL